MVGSEESGFDHLPCLWVLNSLNFFDLDVLYRRMEMDHCLGSRGNQLFGFWEVQNVQSGLEDVADLIEISVVAYDIASQNIVLLDIFDLYLDVLSGWGIGNSNVTWIINLFDFKGLL